MKVLGLVCALLATELLIVSLLYHHEFVFECRAALPAAICAGLSAAVLRAMAVAGVLILVLLARRALRTRFLDGMQTEVVAPALSLQLGGMILLMLPWLYLHDGAAPSVVYGALALWVGGLTLAAVGTAWLIAPWPVWIGAFRQAGLVPAVALALAVATPEIAELAQRIWDPVTEITFAGVGWVLHSLGYVVEADPSIKLIGIAEFGVLVGRQCSGVEGFMLITGFLGFYMWLFRSELRFPAALILLPVGLLLSWTFNVVRIAALILIGHHFSPSLAVNGFHSHAGWLMFTILSISTAAVAHRIPALHRPVDAARPATPRAAPLPFTQDPVAASIFPFFVFMLSALLANTFSHVPGLAYPFRAIAMAAALALFLPVWRNLAWRLDLVSIAAGALIGAAWVVTAPTGSEPELAAALGGLGGTAFVVWVVARVIGTALLVPAIEEGFFRGYILGRIAGEDGQLWRIVLGLAVSTALFAALHDRWLAAALAGLVFAVLKLRSGRVADAILAHAVANAIIAAAAMAAGDWSLI